MDELIKMLKDNLTAIVAIGTSLGVIWKWVASPMQDVQKRLKDLDKDTADLLCSQLTREHDYYITKGWCSASDKQRLDSIYTRYKARGRNHIAEHYMKDIVALPEAMPVKEV